MKLENGQVIARRSAQLYLRRNISESAQETFQRETVNRNRQAGEPLRIVRSGSAEGWILIKESLEWRIIELQIEYEDEHFVWIEASDEPLESS